MTTKATVLSASGPAPKEEEASLNPADPSDGVHTGDDAKQLLRDVAPGKTPLLHKALALTMGAASAGLVYTIATQVAAASNPLVAGALAVGSLVGGYVAADFASGVFHWAVDNYPTEKTPLIGPLARDFQVHHHYGKNILRKSFWHNCGLGGRVLVPMMAGLALLQPHYAVAAAGLSFIGGNILAQGYHMWSHQGNRSKIADAFQKAHLALDRRNHAMHHAMPWDDYYCIVNGMLNPVLHKLTFWRKAEKLVYDITGREPRSWRDPGTRALAMGEITLAEYEDKTRRKMDLKVFREMVEPEKRFVDERLQAQLTSESKD